MKSLAIALIALQPSLPATQPEQVPTTTIEIPPITVTIPPDHPEEEPPVEVSPEVPNVHLPSLPQNSTTTGAGNPPSAPPQSPDDADPPGKSDQKPQEPFPVSEITVESLNFDVDRSVGAEVGFSLLGGVVGFFLGLLVGCFRMGRYGKSK